MGSSSKGGSSGPSKSEIELQEAQSAELETLKHKEDARISAMGRRKRGRATLMSGSELGQTDGLSKTLG